MRERAIATALRRSCVIAWIAWVAGGCALLGGSGAGGDAEASLAGGMDQTRMEMLFGDEVDAIVGPPGALQTRIDEIPVYLISDPANDRMRLIAPIAQLERLDPRVSPVLLQANFHSTLDARYAVSEGVIYSVYLHPISTLTPEELKSAVGQVVSLVKTFGTTFSSSALDLGGIEPESP